MSLLLLTLLLTLLARVLPRTIPTSFVAPNTSVVRCVAQEAFVNRHAIVIPPQPSSRMMKSVHLREPATLPTNCSRSPSFSNLRENSPERALSESMGP